MTVVRKHAPRALQRVIERTREPDAEPRDNALLLSGFRFRAEQANPL